MTRLLAYIVTIYQPTHPTKNRPIINIMQTSVMKLCCFLLANAIMKALEEAQDTIQSARLGRKSED
jgi:hypothetical protein